MHSICHPKGNSKGATSHASLVGNRLSRCDVVGHARVSQKGGLADFLLAFPYQAEVFLLFFLLVPTLLGVPFLPNGTPPIFSVPPQKKQSQNRNKEEERAPTEHHNTSSSFFFAWRSDLPEEKAKVRERSSSRPRRLPRSPPNPLLRRSMRSARLLGSARLGTRQAWRPRTWRCCAAAADPRRCGARTSLGGPVVRSAGRRRSPVPPEFPFFWVGGG